MPSDKHFRLKVLGRLSLDVIVGDIAAPTSLRPRHVAILTYLAMSERAAKRDALVATFWGDEPETNARHSLSNALSALRGVLGPSAISARRDTIELSPELRLAVDAVEFAAACESRDDVRAAELYAGPFFENVAVSGAADLDAWIGRTRNRLERAFVAVCERRVPALLRAGQWKECAQLSEHWLRAAPRSAAAFTSLLRARSGPGTRDAIRSALGDFERMRDWLAADYGLRPDASVQALVGELEAARALHDQTLATSIVTETRREAGAIPGHGHPIESPTPIVSAAAPNGTRTGKAVRRRLARGWTALVAVAAVVAFVAVLARARGPHAAAAATRTVVAITEIENLHGDSALSWLEDGLPQLISDGLAASGTIDPVSPIRVRDVLARRGDTHGPLSERDVLDVGRRLGATWTVRGGLTGGGGAYILNLDVRDVATGSAVESFTVMADNPVKLGQLAAARLLDLATSNQVGTNDPPRFVGATANPEAYRHFVLGLRAMSEGRYPDDSRELEAAIALDSGFVEAMMTRRDLANMRGETTVTRRMDSLIMVHADRLSEWDRLRDEVYRAMYAGEIERSEALAARLVARWSRDPRSYLARADVAVAHGRWLTADSVLVRELSLDSLAMEAGDGPCAPCSAYGGLVSLRLSRGDLAGAEQAARRWVALQPGIPGSWQMLSMALESGGRFDQAIDAARRMVSLTSDPARIADLGRTFIIARQFAPADSVIGVLRAIGAPGRDLAIDLAATMARERG
ncbi:MAG TPA: BTAD domain-containing putative transcriptional regulator, partial [Gemmatimonadaceae bacterium]|nr:BTAD domain-containing putative transcriptional regulator [Gemmatimonadaceae bacterium]